MLTVSILCVLYRYCCTGQLRFQLRTMFPKMTESHRGIDCDSVSVKDMEIFVLLDIYQVVQSVGSLGLFDPEISVKNESAEFWTLMVIKYGSV